MAKLIITNGSVIDPSWSQSLIMCYDYTGDVTLNPTATPAAGGQLIDGDTYYYKVVARMAELIRVDGDSANQLSAWSLNAPNGFRAFWELTNSGTTRRVNIYSHTNHDYLLAYGTRTNDGAITLNAVNGSGISGSVTVAFSAADAGSDNIIRYDCDAIVGFDEVNATPAGANLTIDLAWDAPLGVLIEYRVYCGMATGVYDYFYKVATNSLSDTGLVTKCFDESITKSRVAHVSSLFIPATTANGTEKDARCVLQLYMDWGESHPYDINLKDVTNQPTWNAGTQAATAQAQIDINDWL